MDKIDIAATAEGNSQMSDDGTIRGGETSNLTKLIPGSVIPGTRLKIVRWLGQGGVGVVFEVRHLDIERRYAAKLLNLARNPKRTRRFRDEARTISQLGSPYIVEVFDFQELPDGRLMFVMELVEGASLSSECRDYGPIPLARLLGLCRQVCKGLGDAHDKGFLHRDVKPDNIMVGEGPDGRPQVKLVDFGLATLQGSRRNRNRGGTPAYMSPEQCQGLDLDIRTDIYSLGTSLYELACGHLAFEGDDEQQVRRQHLDETPAPPSSRSAHELPPEFDALVLRCMSKLPDERYASAAELEAAIIELQLGLGLATEWDDLPAPKLDDERRQRQLEEGLASLRERGTRRTRRLRLIGGAFVALIGVAAVVGRYAQLEARAELEQRDRSELEIQRERAVVAASRARWVYPSPDDPERVTAYRVILGIEGLTISEAGAVSRELRTEFADALIELGNTYWELDGGRNFAAEFYRQALVFKPDDALANSRVVLTPGQLASFFSKAESGAFDSHHLRAAETLNTLASAPTELLDGGLDELLDNDATPATFRDQLSQMRDSLEQAQLEEHRDAPAGVSGTGEGETSGAEEGETSGAEEGETGGSEAAPLVANAGNTSGDVQASKQLVSTADAAYNAGNTSKAERLYRQALAKNSRSTEAIVGLHNINFDRGDYRQALKFAERAVSVRPKQGSLRIYAGDACMKVLDFKCARRHYNEAKSLGVSKATKRLARLAEQSGAK